MELKRGEKRIDIGTPESYWNVLKTLQKSVGSQSNKSSIKRPVVDLEIKCPVAGCDWVEAHGACAMCPKMRGKTKK